MTEDRDRDDTEETLTPDRARQLILARRARFMAAALAGIASAGCADGGGDGPGICLSLQPEEHEGRADAEAGASVCLTVDAQVRDGGMDSGPTICLSLRPTCDGSTSRRPGCPIEEAGAPTDASPGDATVPSEGGVQPIDAGRFDGGPQVCLSPVLSRSDSMEDDEVSS